GVVPLWEVLDLFVEGEARADDPLELLGNAVIDVLLLASIAEILRLIIHASLRAQPDLAQFHKMVAGPGTDLEVVIDLPDLVVAQRALVLAIEAGCKFVIGLKRAVHTIGG